MIEACEEHDKRLHTNDELHILSALKLCLQTLHEKSERTGVLPVCFRKNDEMCS